MMEKFFKLIILMVAMIIYLIATTYLINFSILWAFAWELTTITGIAYSDAIKAQKMIRNGWRSWWRLPKRLWTWFKA